jgi:single-stranded-DNA-specific exonuclease
MLTKTKIKKILSERIKEVSASNIPHFSLLKDIKKSSLRVKEAIEKKEKIVVVGDYDVDGTTSCAIMKTFFDKVNYPIEIVIPNRFEDGYGLTPNLLTKIDANLLITVDNGITSVDAAKICEQRGIDLIITDHHTPKETLPKCFAIINPKQPDDEFPFKEICGAEVAWYFCASIKSELKLNIDMKQFLDYLGLAIIADVMPLTDMNRTLVQMALKKLSNSKKPFAIALKEFLNKKEFKAEDIGFMIAPRINSAGRMTSGYEAYKFLVSKDISEANRQLLYLDETNLKRKTLEQEITSKCIELASDQQNFIVVSGEFHEGVVGIVASRLVDKYKLPAIVFNDNGESLKGSGRSLGDVHLFELISECEELLEGFGGHKLACGLSIKKENLEKFTNKIQNLTSKVAEDKFFIEEFSLGELPFSEIDFELIEILNYYEPFGEANPKPKFKAKVEVEHIQNLKENHYKLVLKQNDIYQQGIIFRYDGEFNDVCDITFTINENVFRNQSTIQLNIEKIEF